MLSGGVNSSSVAAIAHAQGMRLTTYTVGTPYGDEFQPAREVASYLGVEHHELLMGPADLQALLPDLIWAMEIWDPLTLLIAAPMAFLYRQMAGQQLILLTGYGADLLFAGTLDPTSSEATLEQTIRLQVALTVSTNEFSPAFAGRHEITVRYPFWTPQLLTTALRIRARPKVHQGVAKYVLRSAMERYLPSRIAWRSKVGIHEGTAMNRLFTHVLGEVEPAAQIHRLKQIAHEVFVVRSARG